MFKTMKRTAAGLLLSLFSLLAFAGLTTAQLQTLKTDILADPVLAAKPMTSGGAFEIAEAYKVVGVVDVWRTDCQVNAIFDAITWTAYTPTDAADGTSTYTNRILAVQTKQMNLQNMLQGRDRVDASRANIRAGLRDAVIALPTGVGGASTSAGGASGATVLAACVRKANRYEALYSTGPVSTGSTSAKLLVVEGNVSVDDVQAARELP